MQLSLTQHHVQARSARANNSTISFCNELVRLEKEQGLHFPAVKWKQAELQRILCQECGLKFRYKTLPP